MNRILVNLGLIIDVVRFEFARSMTRGRIGIWCLLACFPVFLFYLLDLTGATMPAESWTYFQYMFIVEIICQLGLLLWATPVISTEIENQTWIYLAMRQSGRSVVFLGKYLTAILWTLSAALVSMTLCMTVIPIIGSGYLWCVLAVLATFSCIAHAAIFLAIGMLVPRRAMVSAVLYTLLIEYAISLVPAVANKFTVNYRLRSLLLTWTDLDDKTRQGLTFIGTEPTYVHLFLLFTITILGLCIALLCARYTQFPTQQDG